MGKSSDWQLAYIAVQIGVAIWLVLRFSPMLLQIFSGNSIFISMNPVIIGSWVQFLAGLVSGVCLLFGFQRRVAAFTAAVVTLSMGSVGMAAFCVGLIAFNSAVDGPHNEP